MDTITITLNTDEAERLAAIAAHEGETLESLAARTVRERLAYDAEWEADVKAAIAEIERGEYLTLAEYDAHMDALLAKIAPKTSR